MIKDGKKNITKIGNSKLTVSKTWRVICQQEKKGKDFYEKYLAIISYMNFWHYFD